MDEPPAGRADVGRHRRGAPRRPAALRREDRERSRRRRSLRGSRGCLEGDVRFEERRLREGAEVPAARGAPGPARGQPVARRRAGARYGGPDPRRDGARRHPRPGRRRLPSLLDRRDMAGAALREDAVRQRPPRAGVPRRLEGERARRLPEGRRGDSRLGDTRDDRSGGRLLCDARRRQRGGGRAVLRLDAGGNRGDPRTLGRSPHRRLLRRDGGRQLPGRAQHPERAGAAPGVRSEARTGRGGATGESRTRPRAAPSDPIAPRRPAPRRQGPGGMERTDDLRLRARLRADGAGRVPAGGGARRPLCVA